MTYNELIEMLKRLEEKLDQQNIKNVTYNINIDKLIVNEVVLEDLTFKLDGLDIEELSGTLNLGNNLVVKSMKNNQKHEKGKKEKKKREKNIKSEGKDIKINFDSDNSEKKISMETKKEEEGNEGESNLEHKKNDNSIKADGVESGRKNRHRRKKHKDIVEIDKNDGDTEKKQNSG